MREDIEQLIFFQFDLTHYFSQKLVYSYNKSFHLLISENIFSINMFENCASFEKATQMFYSMEYEQGLKLINDCIEKDPKNSILYSNRALFYSQLGFVEEALTDLSSALELNYLNYIAYFNMFSLLMRCQNFDDAFQNLCCSLSCLYLIRAKTKKSELDASKAIKYAQNNMQAHVLKGLIHLQNGKYKLALNELDWACEINPSHEIVRNIRNLIFKKMNPGLPIEQNQTQQGLEEQKNIFYRLQSSYIYEQEDKQKELRDRIVEFNQIYNNLNEYQGTITTKVPKEQENQVNQMNEQIPKENQQKTQQKVEDLQHVSLEEPSKLQQQHNVQQISQQVQEEVQNLESPAPQKPVEFNSEQINGKEQIEHLSENIVEEQTVKNQIDQRFEPNENIVQQTIDKNTPHSETVDQDITFESHHERNVQHRNSMDSRRVSEVLVADDGAATPSRPASIAPEPGQYGSHSQLLLLQLGINEQINDKQFHSINNRSSEAEQNDKFSDFESMINSHTNEDRQEEHFESFISQSQNQTLNESLSVISNALYPKPENAMLQFSILKLEILDRTKQEIEAMANLYCIANYLNVQEGSNQASFKLRTACRKGSETGTEWNETFDPIQIPNNPQCMKIKVYNKKYSSYRDDLIGEMEVEITTHGLVKLPLFNKKGDLSATLLMNLELIFPIIQESEQTESN